MASPPSSRPHAPALARTTASGPALSSPGPRDAAGDGDAEGDADLDLSGGPRPLPRSSRTPIAVAGRRPLRVALLYPRGPLGDGCVDDLLQELRACGYEPLPERLSDLESVRAALEDPRRAWEAILSEAHLADCTAHEVLRELRVRGLDLPFLVVAQSEPEESAGALLQAGASDFLRRQCLSRLGPALGRELRQARLRRERREVVRELRLSRERHRLLLESVRDHAVILLDARGNIHSWSRNAERATGYHRDEAIGMPFAALYEEADQRAGRPQAALRRAAEAGGVSEEGPRVRKDRSRFYAETTLHALFGGTAPEGFLLVLRDQSERRQLLADLRAAGDREAALLSAREELRAQAGALRLSLTSLADALRAGQNGPHEEPVWQGLAALQHQAQRIAEVTRDGAGAPGRLQLRRERFDLSRLLREVATRAQAQVARSGSRLWLRSDEPVFGRWDRLRLEAVISNLLHNALQYGEGKPVELRLLAEPEAARLSVKDRGLGLLPEEQGRLVHGVESGVPSGPSVGGGVGLWIVRQVILAHGGLIEVESQPGEGTTITVLLPYDEARPEPEAP